MVRFLVAALVACSQPQHTEAPVASTPIEDIEEGTFLAVLEPDKPFEVTVESGGMESRFSHSRCAYWEWLYADREKGKLSVWSSPYSSEAPLTLVAGGKRVVLSFRSMRAFLEPSFEHEFKAGDADVPDVVAKAMVKDGVASKYVAEWCVAVGKTYTAAAHDDEFEGPGEGDTIETRTNRVLYVSDRAIVRGRPMGEMTPAYRDWTY